MITAIDLSGGWRPGIGDPTVMGWLTTGAYLATAVLCWRAARREVRLRRSAAEEVSPQFWYLLTAALLGLGINTQLDLQSWLTAVLRQAVRQIGWMDYRRTMQAVFVVVVFMLSLGIIVAVRIRLRHQWTRYRMAWIGMVLILCFVVVRASSFHHVDRFLGLGWPRFKVDHAIELLGIGLVAVGALRVRDDAHSP